MIMEELGNLYDANEEWKDEIIDGFKLIAENLHKDAVDANRETIDLHRNRIERLEDVVGLPHDL